jgi:hypothetical protein
MRGKKAQTKLLLSIQKEVSYKWDIQTHKNFFISGYQIDLTNKQKPFISRYKIIVTNKHTKTFYSRLPNYREKQTHKNLLSNQDQVNLISRLSSWVTKKYGEGGRILSHIFSPKKNH